MLSANGDAHAKNFSVLQQPDGEWRVAPAYDVPTSQPYGDSTLAAGECHAPGPRRVVLRRAQSAVDVAAVAHSDDLDDEDRLGAAHFGIRARAA